MKKRSVLLLLALLVVFAAIDLGLGLSHGEEWWAKVPAFFALLGGLGCFAIILIAKALGRFWLTRKEDYYDSGRDND